MIAAIDIETQGLNSQALILGTIETEKGEQYTFRTRQEAWEILENKAKTLGKSAQTLQLYGFNHEFDFYGYADLRSHNITIYSLKPFIASYEKEHNDNGKKYTAKISFLDARAIYSGTLATAAKLISMEKGNTPEKVKTEKRQEFSKEELAELEKYCKQDTKACLNLILYLKGKLTDEGMRLKRLVTINQIAMNYVLSKLKQKKREYLFYQDAGTYPQRKIIYTLHQEEIHEAYRMGRNEAWKTGITKGTSYIDCNSLYPYAAVNMRFPDLRTAEKIYEPLKIMKIDEILRKIGVTRCIVRNNTNELGILPVRCENSSYYFGPGKEAIGTWTNQELKEAIDKGYSIEEAHWTIQYQEAKENPLKEIYQELYKKRTESQTEYDYWLYKRIMNSSIGKFAQRKTDQELKIRSVAEVEELKEKGFEPIKGLELEYIYRKEPEKPREKKYYCPIIPVLITADARIYMNRQFEKIPKEDLVYTDTDSIIFKGNHKNKFAIGKKMGEFKLLEQRYQDAKKYGEKQSMKEYKEQRNKLRKAAREIQKMPSITGNIKVGKSTAKLKDSHEMTELASRTLYKRLLKPTLNAKGIIKKKLLDILSEESNLKKLRNNIETIMTIKNAQGDTLDILSKVGATAKEAKREIINKSGGAMNKGKETDIKYDTPYKKHIGQLQEKGYQYRHEMTGIIHHIETEIIFRRA